MRITINGVYFVLAVLLAAFGLLISPLWTYLANVFVGVPTLALSWVFWRLAKREQPDARRHLIAPRLWLATGVVAAVSLVAFLVTNS